MGVLRGARSGCLVAVVLLTVALWPSPHRADAGQALAADDVLRLESGALEAIVDAEPFRSNRRSGT